MMNIYICVCLHYIDIQRVCRITLIMHARIKQTGKPYDLKVFESLIRIAKFGYNNLYMRTIDFNFNITLFRNSKFQR
jgi:hypothetical protein